MTEKLITAGMLADRLRPIVLGGDHSCLNGTPMIPLHRGTVSAIYQHLERLADMDGEKTLGALEHDLARHMERSEEGCARLASAIEAQRATTVQQGVVHESAVPEGQTPEPGSRGPDNG